MPYASAVPDNAPTGGCAATVRGTPELAVVPAADLCSGHTLTRESRRTGRWNSARLDLTYANGVQSPLHLLPRAGMLTKTAPSLAFGDVRVRTRSFLRWDPADAAQPARYLGGRPGVHKVVGGTCVPAGQGQPVDRFAILETRRKLVRQTDAFTVSGTLAGPLQTDLATVDFGPGGGPGCGEWRSVGQARSLLDFFATP